MNRPARILVAATSGAGHVTPLLPFADAFAKRGDDVLLIGPPALDSTVRGTGHDIRIGAAPPEDEVAAIWRRVPDVSRAEASILINRELFGRMGTAALLPTMLDTCREWRPDLVLREPSEYASAVATERPGIRHAQVAISLADVEASTLELVAPALADYGGDIVERIIASPYLTRFPASLDQSPFPVTYRFREAATEIAANPLPDWWDGDDAPLVYLTLGTIAGRLPIGVAAYQAVLDAVDGLKVRVLLTVGRSFDPASLPRIPPNVHVETWVPQADSLGSAAVVCCHGGSGTTFGALSAGVPLVVVPMFADQPANGRRLTATGAGIVVEPSGGDRDTMGAFGPADTARIRSAIESVLTETSYRTAAILIADEMRQARTVDDVINLLTDDPAWMPPIGATNPERPDRGPV
jgi:UDP:flavonoid glycosyltransferase YjiC (YdhE family)